MKRITKAIVLILIIATLTLSLSSCLMYGFGMLLFGYEYDGGHDDLYTVAVNNMFYIQGYTNNGEITYNPEISIIETDNYGRTLFFYNESYGAKETYTMAFLIMQKSEDGYVYYYQDECYLPFIDDSDYFWHGTKNGEDYKKAVDMSADLIKALKDKNDWNKEITIGKCHKAKIETDISERGELALDSYDFDEIIYKKAKKNGYTGNDDQMVRTIRYVNSDRDGKELYAISCMTRDDDENGNPIFGYFGFAVIVDPDMKIFSDPELADKAIAEITDPCKYYDVVYELKKQNDWKH